MASLLDAIEANRTRKGPECTVQSLHQRLDKSLRADFDKAFASLKVGAIHATELSRALATLGHKVSPDALRRHLRNDCACARDNG